MQQESVKLLKIVVVSNCSTILNLFNMIYGIVQILLNRLKSTFKTFQESLNLKRIVNIISKACNKKRLKKIKKR